MKIARAPYKHEVIKPLITSAGTGIIFLPIDAEIIPPIWMDFVQHECIKHPFVLDLTDFIGGPQ